MYLVKNFDICQTRAAQQNQERRGCGAGGLPKYQQGHKGQAAKLAKEADLDKAATNREFDWLAIMAINRLLVLSPTSVRSRCRVPTEPVRVQSKSG